MIADIIINSEKNKGTSTLKLSFDKKLVSDDIKQVLTLQIYGEEASTLYPINVPTNVFEFELADIIQSYSDREGLSQGIYTRLIQNLKAILDPTSLEATRFEGSGAGPDIKVDIALTQLLLKVIINLT